MSHHIHSTLWHTATKLHSVTSHTQHSLAHCYQTAQCHITYTALSGALLPNCTVSHHSKQQYSQSPTSQFQNSHSETKFIETTPYQATCHSKEAACLTTLTVPERPKSIIKPIYCIRAQKKIVISCNALAVATNTASELDAPPH